jgi:hypothetical protein
LGQIVLDRRRREATRLLIAFHLLADVAAESARIRARAAALACLQHHFPAFLSRFSAIRRFSAFSAAAAPPHHSSHHSAGKYIFYRARLRCTATRFQTL